MTPKDQTYCASPNCTNECGRKMSKDLEKEIYWTGDLTHLKNGIWYAYFCGEVDDNISKESE